MFVELDGVAIEFDQISDNWHVTDANPEDWRYSIENGTYWGIRPTLEEALAGKSDIVQLKEDFNFTSDDLAREWQVRHGIDCVYFGNNDSCEF